MSRLNYIALLLVGLVCTGSTFAAYGAVDTSYCYVCKHFLHGTVYSCTDEMDDSTKKLVCEDCELHLPRCFLCGLPTLTNVTESVHIQDGRWICGRDKQDCVLDKAEALQLCASLLATLERQFSRFINLPEANVKFAVLDRVELRSVYQVTGADDPSPDTRGLTSTRTNNGCVQHQIKVLSGVPRDWFLATCAHECGHAWINENVPAERNTSLDRDTVEGFCELLSYLCMDALHEERAKKEILKNLYTRGQIQAFIKAEEQYGFNDVVEWIKYGDEESLDIDRPEMVRNLNKKLVSESKTARPANPFIPPAPPFAAPKVDNELTLKAVLWNPQKPSAIINNATFFTGDESKISLGGTNVVLRCLEIRQDRVRVKVTGKTADEILMLRKSGLQLQ